MNLSKKDENQDTSITSICSQLSAALTYPEIQQILLNTAIPAMKDGVAKFPISMGTYLEVIDLVEKIVHLPEDTSADIQIINSLWGSFHKLGFKVHKQNSPGQRATMLVIFKDLVNSWQACVNHAIQSHDAVKIKEIIASMVQNLQFMRSYFGEALGDFVADDNFVTIISMLSKNPEYVSEELIRLFIIVLNSGAEADTSSFVTESLFSISRVLIDYSLENKLDVTYDLLDAIFEKIYDEIDYCTEQGEAKKDYNIEIHFVIKKILDHLFSHAHLNEEQVAIFNYALSLQTLPYEDEQFIAFRKAYGESKEYSLVVKVLASLGSLKVFWYRNIPADALIHAAALEINEKSDVKQDTANPLPDLTFVEARKLELLPAHLTSYLQFAYGFNLRKPSSNLAQVNFLASLGSGLLKNIAATLEDFQLAALNRGYDLKLNQIHELLSKNNLEITKDFIARNYTDKKQFYIAYAIYHAHDKTSILESLEYLIKEPVKDLAYWELLYSILNRCLSGLHYSPRRITAGKVEATISALILVVINQMLKYNIPIESKNNLSHMLEIMKLPILKQAKSLLNGKSSSDNMMDIMKRAKAVMQGSELGTIYTELEEALYGICYDLNEGNTIAKLLPLDVKADGDCAFHVLGISRQQGISLLLNHVQSQQTYTDVINILLDDLEFAKNSTYARDEASLGAHKQTILAYLRDLSRPGIWMPSNQNSHSALNALAILMRKNLKIYAVNEVGQLLLYSSTIADPSFRTTEMLVTSTRGYSTHSANWNHYIHLERLPAYVGLENTPSQEQLPGLQDEISFFFLKQLKKGERKLTNLSTFFTEFTNKISNPNDRRKKEEEGIELTTIKVISSSNTL